MTQAPSKFLALLCLISISLTAQDIKFSSRNAHIEKINHSELQKAEAWTMESLEAAINDMTKKFSKYPKYFPETFKKYKAAYPSKKNDPAFMAKFNDFRRRALIANPYLVSQPLLINIREQFWGSHCPHGTMYITAEDNKTGGGGLRMFREDGAAIKLLHFSPKGYITKTENLITNANGNIRDPEIHFSGKKVLVSYRKNKEDDYNIFEVDVKTKETKQITWGKEFADVDPIYLPNDKIAFSSTREPKYCQCNIHIMPNLFLTEKDGANTIQISRNGLADFHGNLMPDGRIIYSRWEYVDRQFGASLGLWTCNPDGTQHQLYMGNNSWSPGAMLDARAIPGTDKIVTIYGSCHDRPWGALVIADRSKGTEGKKPIVKIWPKDAINRIKEATPAYTRDMRYRGDIDSTMSLPVKYEDPYPLHNYFKGTGGGTYFLVSKTIGKMRNSGNSPNGQANQGIFIVDTFGNETLVYAEDAPHKNCFDPMPLSPRKRPARIANKVNLKKNYGTYYVQDVYLGTDDEMKNVKRGDIKYLRIVEAPPKTFWREDGTRWGTDARQASAMNWNVTTNKRIIGDVPVEEDGSAHFYVPSDTFIHFLALDKNKQMIQAMRTGTMLRPGEVQGCVGCHEDRVNPPKVSRRFTLAAKRKPSKPEPWMHYKSFKSTPQFNYLTEVQPVFDKNCVSCHDYDNAKGDLNLAGDVGLIFNQSYIELMRKSRIRYDGPREVLVSSAQDGPPGVLPAYAWGSHKSRLVKVLQQGHHGVKLSKEEMDRIITWIDLNSVYYGEYSSVYAGRVPLSSSEVRELFKLGKIGRAQQMMQDGEFVSFNRPEKSRILKQYPKNSPQYKRLLEIIYIGKRNLEKQPREDQLGAKTKLVYPPDIYKAERYKRNLEQERLSKEAILNGRKHYQYKNQ